ncbi:hypothetical protein ACFY36_25830 [Actinoplanes sp. NPDC000266]
MGNALFVVLILAAAAVAFVVARRSRQHDQPSPTHHTGEADYPSQGGSTPGMGYPGDYSPPSSGDGGGGGSS